MNDTIDKIDRRILGKLQTDASLSVDQLAEHVHLSRNACWRRVKRLEADGFIKKRVALLDADKLGLGLQAIVMIRTNTHSADWLQKFRAAVREMPEITSAQRTSGDLDYILRVRVSDVSAYDHFYQRLIAKLDIADVSASFVMEELKDTTALPL